MKKIVFTGGTGRFANVFKLIKNKYKIEYPSKTKLNIEKFDSINNYLKKNKPNYLIHCAGLSRPMKIHDEDISRSILINIIGKTSQSTGLPFQKVNIDEDTELAARYGVRSVPTILKVDSSGQEIKRQVGLQSKENVLNWYNG